MAEDPPPSGGWAQRGGTSGAGGTWAAAASWGSWGASSWAPGQGTSWGSWGSAEATSSPSDQNGHATDQGEPAAEGTPPSTSTSNTWGWTRSGSSWGAWSGGGWSQNTPSSQWNSSGTAWGANQGWSGSGAGWGGAWGGASEAAWGSFAGSASARSSSVPAQVQLPTGAGVFVGDLSADTSVAALNAHFAYIGTVRYATLHKDRSTGQGRGSGKVVFAEDAAANRAVDELNGSWLDGRQIAVRILSDDPPPSRRENDGRQVFVGGFGTAIDADGLREFCQRIGGVTYSAIFKDRESGNSRGCGRVDFGTVDQAQSAVQELHGTELEGRTVTVEIMGQEGASRRPAPGLRPLRRTDGRQVFVGSLASEIDVEALTAFCEQVGPVTYCAIFTDRETGRRKGAGKVEFETAEQAQTAIEKLNGAKLGGRNVVLELMGQERPPRPAREEVDPACKLFIGSLPAAATEEQLQELLGQAGEVKAVSVFSNHRGTAAKATMSSAEEAQRAITVLNDSWFIGERIFVRLDGPPPERKKPQLEAMIFVGGLSWETTVDTLRDHFSCIGDIVHAAVFLDRDTGRSRGSGKVEFASPDLAQRAIEELHDSELEGRRLQVKRMEPNPPGGDRQPRGPPGPRGPREQNDGRQVFFGSLNRETEPNSLHRLCEDRLGVPCTVTIFRDRETGQPRGAAKAEFETTEDAQRAIQELDGVELDGQRLAVRLMGEERKPAQPDGRTVFVGGLSWSTNDEDFKSFFEQAGEVTYSSVFMDRETGKPKGCGKVQFRTEDEAQKAINELSGQELDGREISVRLMETGGTGKGKSKGKGKGPVREDEE